MEAHEFKALRENAGGRWGMTQSEQARADAIHWCDACKDFPPNRRPPTCFVCRGAGYLPDSMPAADAFADAETLRLATTLPKVLTGNSVTNCARRTDTYAETFSFARAREAARAAFRAVPGLRGDR